MDAVAAATGPNEDATVVGIGVDPLFTQLPVAQLPGATSTSAASSRYTHGGPGRRR